jgi:hypothetical protein
MESGVGWLEDGEGKMESGVGWLEDGEGKIENGVGWRIGKGNWRVGWVGG